MAHQSRPQAEQQTDQPSDSLLEVDNVAPSVHPAWLLLPAVAAAGLILGELCPWLRPGTLPQAGLLVLAVSLLFTAVMISGFVARILSKKLSPTSSNITVQAACLTALWIPAWVLFAETWSWLMMLAGTLCLASLGAALKRQTAPATPDNSPTQPTSPFQFETTPLGRALLPSLAAAILAEAAIALMAARRYPMASLAFGLCAAAIAWRSTPSHPLSIRPRLGLTTTTAFLLTVIALLPYLKVSPLRGGLASLLQPAHLSRPQGGTPKDPSASPSDGYSGIILLSPSEQRKKIALPVKLEFTLSTTRLLEPMEIPFDGAYWYFKPPDHAPRPNAHIVRLSSLKANIHSSDWKPLLMEAHQKLADPIDLGCCSAIQLGVENQDHREGAIALELWVKLRSQTPPSPHYLGTMTIPSSVHASPGVALPTEEKLRFPIPSAMGGVRFDEITIAVRPALAHSRNGAQIAIRRFILEP